MNYECCMECSLTSIAKPVDFAKVYKKMGEKHSFWTGFQSGVACWIKNSPLFQY